MDMKEVMGMRRFAIAGDTLNPQKYAFRIRKAMEDAGYQVYAVGKELASLNEIPGDPEVIDLCIHPVKGLRLLKEYKKPIPCVVIQPGAESPELLAWLQEHRVPYLQNCLLQGLAAYGDAGPQI